MTYSREQEDAIERMARRIIIVAFELVDLHAREQGGGSRGGDGSEIIALLPAVSSFLSTFASYSSTAPTVATQAAKMFLLHRILQPEASDPLGSVGLRGLAQAFEQSLIDRGVDRNLAWLSAEAFVSTAVAQPDLLLRVSGDINGQVFDGARTRKKLEFRKRLRDVLIRWCPWLK